MLQIPVACTDAAELRVGLRELAADERVSGARAVVLSLFTDTVDAPAASDALAIARDELPQALVFGCSMNGGIARGALDDSPALAFCTAFEDPGTRAELLQFEFGEEGAAGAARGIVREVAARPWARAVVLLTTSGSDDMAPFCEELSRIDGRVQVVGGGACDRDISDDPGYVFSTAGGTTAAGVAALVLGGPRLAVSSARVSGWQPLGRELRVTRREGTVVDEFNGEPAFRVYSHYLKIDSGSGFYSNALEFPLLFEADDGMQIPQVPTRAGRGGELYLATAVRTGAVAHIAYGDPDSILREVEDAASDFADAGCEAIVAFDCASRRKFWGDEDCSGETMLFDSVAPTMGFYTGGEICRGPSGRVHLNNTSIVLVGLSERGAQADARARGRVAFRGGWVRKRLSVVHRMANFVNVAVADLEEANAKLRELAAADPLTGLLNRGEIERRIERTLEDAGRAGTPVSVIMLDIDDYKRVNDEFGHQRGDEVLRSLSRLMRDIVGVMAPGASMGRWGGDEFMILVPDADLARARELAEAVRRAFSAISIGGGSAQTVSAGVAQARPRESADVLCSRVDERLYEAKRAGKNRVCG